jgi:kinesin family member 11
LSTALEEHNRAKRARIDATNLMTTKAMDQYRQLGEMLEGSQENAESFSRYFETEVSDTSYSLAYPINHHMQITGLRNASETYRSAAMSQLETVSKASKVVLEEGVTQDKVTGSTPRKQTRTYQDRWELTRPHEVILAEWRLPQGHQPVLQPTNPLNTLEQSVFPSAPPSEELMLTSEELPSSDELDAENHPIDSQSSTESVDTVLPFVPTTHELKAPIPRGKLPRRAASMMGTLTDARNTYTTRMPHQRGR